MFQTYFFYGVLPILVYAFVDACSHNLRVAVVASVIASFAEMLLLFSKTGVIDPVSLTGTCLFLGLGAYSLRTEDRFFFKLQPAISAALVGFIIGYLQFFGQPVLDRYWPFLSQILPSEQQALLQSPEIKGLLNRMFSGLTFILFLNAGWIAYAAKRQSQRTWLLVNIFGLFFLMTLLVIGVVAQAMLS